MEEEHKKLKFKNKFIDDIVEQRYETTFRVELEGKFEPGETIKLVNKQGYKFGMAEVLWIKHTTLHGVEPDDFGEHHIAATPGQLRRNLRSIYDREVEYTEPLQVIKFRTLDSTLGRGWKKGRE